MCFRWLCPRRAFQPMPLTDQLFMDPFEKWRVYGKFPWKLAVHISLAVLTLVEVMTFAVQEAGHARSSLMHFYQIFLGHGTTGDYGTRSYTVSDVSDLRGSIDRMTSNFFHINQISIDKYTYQADLLRFTVSWSNGTDSQFEIDEGYQKDARYDYLRDHARDVKYMRMHMGLTEVFAGPLWVSCFDWRVLPTFDFEAAGLLDISLNWHIIECSPPESAGASRWRGPFVALHSAVLLLAAASLVLSLKSIRESVVVLSRVRQAVTSPQRLTQGSQPANSGDHSRRHSIVQIHPPPSPEDKGGDGGSLHPSLDGRGRGSKEWGTKGSGSGSLCLSLHREHSPAGSPGGLLHGQGRGRRVSVSEERRVSIVEASRPCVQIPGGPIGTVGEVYTWEDLSWVDKLQFFNLWFLITIVGNFTQLFAATLCMMTNVNIAFRLGALGIGCFLAWTNLLRYLEYFSKYYVLMRTMARGVPRILEFLAAVVPLFLAYAALGVSLFWATEQFGNMSWSCLSLFSVLNGDDIRNVFKNLKEIHPMFGEIYLYSFLCLFMYVVLNVFISIIEDAFFTEKAKIELDELEFAEAEEAAVRAEDGSGMQWRDGHHDAADAMEAGGYALYGNSRAKFRGYHPSEREPTRAAAAREKFSEQREASEGLLLPTAAAAASPGSMRRSPLMSPSAGPRGIAVSSFAPFHHPPSHTPLGNRRSRRFSQALRRSQMPSAAGGLNALPLPVGFQRAHTENFDDPTRTAEGERTAPARGVSGGSYRRGSLGSQMQNLPSDSSRLLLSRKRRSSESSFVVQSRLHDSAGWLTRMVSPGAEKGGGRAGEGRRGGSGDSGRLRGKEGKDSLEGKDLQRPLLCDIEEASGVSGGADGEGGGGAQLELQEEQVKSEEEKERESGDKRRQGGGGEEAFETPSRPAQGFRGEEFAPGSAFRSSSMDERIAFHRYQSRTGSQETERTTRLMRLQGEDGGRRVRHDSREPSLPSPTRELLETGEWEEVDTEGHERERSMRGRDRRLATAFRRTGTTPAFSDSQGSTRRSAQVSHPHPAATSPIPFARSNPALQRANTGAVALPPFARRDSPGSTTRGRGRGGTTTFARTGSSASIASGGGGGSGLPGSATRRRDVNPKIEALLRATDLLEGGEWSGTSAPPQSGGVRGARDPVHLGGTMPSQQYPSMPSQSGSPLGESPTEEVFLGPGMRHSAASDGDELVQQQHGPGRRDGGGSVQDSAIGASLLGAAGSRVMSLEGHQLESEKETEEGVRPLRRTR
eukprot:Cvel_11466.t1-p1 / transcript=Cvel_11466.t1 / gene=Cvel_11466 / organism=Chromera_velia_CCMP2878 / gene_product=Mucolipin-2, putative / transcript_product=Mucolipin-2, putative / location=Cvel_scaffold721:63832-71391(+) / protein_length=1263 / sequence_SO=supercontig / SO=protein_coding / is_pseudo=false